MAEGKIATYEKGEIVVRLIEQEEADEEEALIAASRCDDFDAAIELLAQECQLCMNVPKLTEVKKNCRLSLSFEKISRWCRIISEVVLF